MSFLRTRIRFFGQVNEHRRRLVMGAPGMVMRKFGDRKKRAHPKDQDISGRKRKHPCQRLAPHPNGAVHISGTSKVAFLRRNAISFGGDVTAHQLVRPVAPISDQSGNTCCIRSLAHASGIVRIQSRKLVPLNSVGCHGRGLILYLFVAILKSILLSCYIMLCHAIALHRCYTSHEYQPVALSDGTSRAFLRWGVPPKNVWLSTIND